MLNVGLHNETQASHKSSDIMESKSVVRVGLPVAMSGNKTTQQYYTIYNAGQNVKPHELVTLIRTVYDASRVQVVHIIGDETTQTYQDQGI